MKRKATGARKAPETQKKTTLEYSRSNVLNPSGSLNKPCFNKNEYGNYIIPCLPRKDVEGFKFWCVDCKRWHLHGSSEGHRVSHCFNEKSRLAHVDYYVRYMTPDEYAEYKAHSPKKNFWVNRFEGVV